VAFIQGALIIGYPFLIFFGLGRFGVRTTAAALLLLTVLQAGLRWLTRGTSNTSPQRAAAPWFVPLISGLVLLASAASNDRRFMLLVPTLINLGLLFTFASSLLGEVSLVERFASWYVTDLRPEERRYCRRVTQVWCAFFVLNGGVALATALWAPLSWWSLYNGVVAYGLIGLIFAVEFIVRKYRFRRFGTMFYDRWLMQVLPVPTLDQSPPMPDGPNAVSVRVHVPAQSRHFAGHFPNRPILAGVVQLAEIILPTIEQTWSDLGPLIQIKRLKFKALIGPDEDLEVHIDRTNVEVRFRITRGERECAAGVLEFAGR
jgi:uncharacterized membrane protein/3-hydroxymyristoyl/3-hydroxydecanoyl-(acyl carrier protein) dehydratase